jgi:hypothetical protein
MTVFVSYAKSDIGLEQVARRERLWIISHAVSEQLGPAFVDEIHNVDGTHAAVEAALVSATSFCLVRGDAYGSGRWTRWEYQRARQRCIPMYELSCADLGLQVHRPATTRLRGAGMELRDPPPARCGLVTAEPHASSDST